MASAIVKSKAVVRFLLLLLLWEFVSSVAVHCRVSILVSQSYCWGRENWLRISFVFMISCDWYVALHLVAMGWSAVFDC